METVRGGDRPRVAGWHNIPAPYLIERFTSLADRANIDLEAWVSVRAHGRDGRNGAVIVPGDPETLALSRARSASASESLASIAGETRRMIDGSTPDRSACDFAAAVDALPAGDVRATRH